MTDPSWMAGPPARLLLATDLSARSDRALDRVVQLAGEWNAALHLLTVLEFPGSPDEQIARLGVAGAAAMKDEANLRLRDEIAGLDVDATTHVAEGNLPNAIRDTAAAAACDLVVAGMARSETLGRYFVGSTVERLARILSQPLLVVRSRVRGPYGRILVATDLSESSRHALDAAVRFFPGHDLLLYHSFETPAAIGDGPELDAATRSNVEDQCMEFLAATRLTDAERAHITLVIDHGRVGVALPRYVRENAIDLAILGTQGRSRIMNVLLGQSAAQLLAWLRCDTMLVREPR